jgi:hypothetical protein
VSYSTGPLPLATTDQHDTPGSVELHCFGAGSALVTVTNAAAVIQVAEPGPRRPDSALVWDVEWYAIPGSYPLDAGDGQTIDGVRIRSATPGTPAHVAIVAYV